MRKAGESTPIWGDGDYVFTTGLGRPVLPDTVTNLMAVLIRQHADGVAATFAAALDGDPDADDPQARCALTWGSLQLPRLVSIQIFEIQSLAGCQLPHGGPRSYGTDGSAQSPGEVCHEWSSDTPRGSLPTAA